MTCTNNKSYYGAASTECYSADVYTQTSQPDLDHTELLSGEKRQNTVETSAVDEDRERDTFEKNSSLKDRLADSKICRPLRLLNQRLASQIHGQWAKAMIWAGVGAATVLLVNMILVIVMMSRSHIERGIATIYTGHCSTAARWDTIVHLLINVLSTCLLEISNYAIQCLTSPTRSEVDHAHAQGKSLTIGVRSMLNLQHMKKSKRWLCCVLLLSSLPLHLFWNSLFFTTLGANEFSVAAVRESFFDLTEEDIDDHPDVPGFNDWTLWDIHQAYQDGKYSQRLGPEECIPAYSELLTDRRNVIMVLNDVSQVQNNGTAISEPDVELSAYSALGVFTEDNSIDSFLSKTNTAWLCSGYFYAGPGGSCQVTPAHPSTACENSQPDLSVLLSNDDCDRSTALDHYHDFGQMYILMSSDQAIPQIDASTYLRASIDYCLSEVQVAENCQLQFVPVVFFIVIALNIIKVVCIILTVHEISSQSDTILATTGDAIASFLDKPDSSTLGSCLLNRKQVVPREQSADPLPTEQVYENKNKQPLYKIFTKVTDRALHAPMVVYLIIIVIIVRPAILKAQAILGDDNAVLSLGFGNIDASLILTQGSTDISGLVANIVEVNAPQMILSSVYVCYNTYLTSAYAALEWASYADVSKPKALRVSHPRGPHQKSTFFLSLPWKIGLPLLASSIASHFFLSQTIFLARIQWYDPTGEQDPTMYLSSVCYSEIGWIVLLGFSCFLILTISLMTVRQVSNVIPANGGQSLVISAMCHLEKNESDQAEQEDSELVSLKLLCWGATRQPSAENPIGHCSFTSGDAEVPIIGGIYR